MKRKTILTMALSCCMLAATAQVTIKDVLCNMPETIIPYIGEEQREEICKFTNETDTIKIKNELNGFTEVNLSGTDFALIKLNESATLQIKLLPMNDTVQIICMAKTMTTPISESNVKFYSTDWNPINDSFGLPQFPKSESLAATFTQRPDTMPENKYEELLGYFDPVTVYADISKKDNVITYSLGIPLASKAEKNELKAIIKPKSYKWAGLNFKKL